MTIKLSVNLSTKKQHNSVKSVFAAGMMLGTLLGASTAIGYLYLRDILKHPELASIRISPETENFDRLESSAYFIASQGLLSGIAERSLKGYDQKLILHAGYRNFRESWARDFGFAAYGLIELGKIQAVRDTLHAFFTFQAQNGQFPVKLRSMSVVTRFLHALLKREQSLEGELSPKYITGHRTPSLDGQALLINAACVYVQHCSDKKFAIENWDNLKRGIGWLARFARPKDGLLEQPAYSDWADSVARQGVVFYTNTVYWKAIKSMAELAEQIGEHENADFYEDQARMIQQALQSELWRPHLGYFASDETLDNLGSAGNLLAISWGLADKQQSLSILDHIQAFHMAEPVPTQAAYPSYPKNKIAIENRLGGVANYHTEGAWLWIGAWHLIALCRTGQLDEGRKLATRIAETVVRDQQINEVYDRNSQPLSSFWYTSEAPLTWNAGMLVYAFKQFKNCLFG